LAQKFEFECVVGFGAKNQPNQPFPDEPAKTSSDCSFSHPVHPASQNKAIRTGCVLELRKKSPKG